VVTDVREGVLHLDAHLEAERLAAEGGIVVNHFPLILGIGADDIVVEGFRIDASVADPQDVLKDMRSAAVYLYRCRDAALRHLIVSGAQGDAICCAKSSVRAAIEDCEAVENSFYGIHPGSHSAWCAVRRCRIHHNDSDGLYICWGIRHGVFEDNDIHHNGVRLGRNGICIGPKDTDNLIRRNHVWENAKHGIHFRRKTEPNGAHRNTILENVIENNGPVETGAGVWIEGVTHDLVFERNTIRETRSGAARTQQHAFVLRPGVSRVKLVDNAVSGHPGPAVVDESGSRDNDLQGLA
jgi:hypothetical protein